MKDFYVKLIEAAVVLVFLIVFIFVLADSKMESEKLRLKISLMEDENEKLRIESQEIRKVYSALLIRLVNQNKVTIKEISASLPAKEWEVFNTMQSKKKMQ